MAQRIKPLHATLTSNIEVLVQILAALLPIQVPPNVSRSTADCSSTCALVIYVEHLGEVQTSLYPFGD